MMKLSNFFSSMILISILFFFFFFNPYGQFTGKSVSSTPSSATIDTGILVIRDTLNGSTTDFVVYSDTALESITNLTIENSLYGKVIWPGPINITQDVIDNIVDLDSNVSITFNFVSVDTTMLSSLEAPATIYLYNLSFLNPRIMRNGAVCPDSICTKISYLGGTLIFTTTQFSTYYAEETPSVATAGVSAGGGSGSSGGGSPSPRASMLSVDLMKVYLNQGETKKEFITLQNKGKKNRIITLVVDQPDLLMSLEQSSYVLTPGETKDIPIIFSAPADLPPGVYYGTVMIQEEQVLTPLRVLIEVHRNKPTFSVDLILKDKQLEAGETLHAQFKVNGLREGSKMYFVIKDFDGGIIFKSEEETLVSSEKSMVVQLPNNMVVGDYIFLISVSEKGEEAIASDIFEVIAPHFIV